MMRSFATGLAVVAALMLAADSSAAEWGTLKGQFIYDGNPPAPAKLNITKDVEVCSLHPPVDESLLVGPNGGIKNVVVYIRSARGEKLEVHPDYEAAYNQPVELDNEHCRFTPHVALLRTGQTLVLKNSDPVGHNSKIDCFVNPPLNVLIPASGETEQTMTLEERLPVQVGCNIHPWMTAYLIVRHDPYMTVSAEDGTFEIKNIPAGEHEFQFWHEKAGYLGDLDLNDGGESDSRGRADIEIEAGELDLGQIEVDDGAFED